MHARRRDRRPRRGSPHWIGDVDLPVREHDVAIAVGHGKTNAEIATELYVGVATVKAHITRILSKLDLGNRTQRALLMHDAGLY